MYNNISESDFSFGEDVNGVTVVKIENGQYAGVEYQYRSVQIREEGDQGILSFNYDVVNDSGKDVTTNDFTNMIGDILTYVISDAVDDDSFSIGTPNGNIDSNDDLEKST